MKVVTRLDIANNHNAGEGTASGTPVNQTTTAKPTAEEQHANADRVGQKDIHTAEISFSQVGDDDNSGKEVGAGFHHQTVFFTT